MAPEQIDLDTEQNERLAYALYIRGVTFVNYTYPTDAEMDEFVFLRKYLKGQNFPASSLPTMGTASAKHPKIGDVASITNKLILVSEFAREILSKLDLGASVFSPFEIKYEDVAGGPENNYFIFVPRASKNSLVPEKSTNLEGPGEYYTAGPDAEFSLSEKSINGSDIWLEETIPSWLFMSKKAFEIFADFSIKRPLYKQCRITG